MSRRSTDPVRRLPAKDQWAFVGLGWAPPGGEPAPERRYMCRTIVTALLGSPEVLGVTRSVLVRDIRQRFQVSPNAAYRAIERASRCHMLDLGAPFTLVSTKVDRCPYRNRPTFAPLLPPVQRCDHSAIEQSGSSAVS